jgi:long-subunit acyl-CoA synthetase (AMP-forming)
VLMLTAIMLSDITFMPPKYYTKSCGAGGGCGGGNSLGRPLPSLEVKLVSDGGASARKSRNIYRGQIYVRGPSFVPSTPTARANIVPKNDSDKGDGYSWVKTGAIGEWDASKRTIGVIGYTDLNLRDRHLGEYIPIQVLEGIYTKIPYVVECILINSWKSVPLIAIICE